MIGANHLHQLECRRITGIGCRGVAIGVGCAAGVHVELPQPTGIGRFLDLHSLVRIGDCAEIHAFAAEVQVEVRGNHVPRETVGGTGIHQRRHRRAALAGHHVGQVVNPDPELAVIRGRYRLVAAVTVRATVVGRPGTYGQQEMQLAVGLAVYRERRCRRSEGARHNFAEHGGWLFRVGHVEDHVSRVGRLGIGSFASTYRVNTDRTATETERHSHYRAPAADMPLGIDVRRCRCTGLARCAGTRNGG